MPSTPADTWYCSECGALNSGWYDHCPVCSRGRSDGGGYGGGGGSDGTQSSSHRDSDTSPSLSPHPVWSSTSSITSDTSFGSFTSYGGHNFVLQETIELFSHDRVTRQLLSKATQIGIASDRIERRLRRLLKRLGADLQTESATVEQRRIAKFIAIKSRSIASETLKGMDGFESAPRRPPRRQIETIAEVVESSSEEDTEPEADDPVQDSEENNLLMAKKFVAQSAAFAMMQQQLWHSVFPTLSTKILAYVEDTSENTNWVDVDEWLSQGQKVATELYDVYLHSVHTRKNISTPKLDRLKAKIEALSGGTWDWWPLRTPLGSSGENCAYLQWTCHCGEERILKAPEALADEIERWQKELPQRETLPPKSGSPLSHSSNSGQQSKIQKPRGHDSTHQSASSSSRRTHSIQGKTNPIPITASGQKSLGWLLLIVQSKGDYKLAQINMTGHTTDSFFAQLRSDYLRLRGYIARCFSVWCYSHCEFYEFHLWNYDSVVPSERNQYPDPSDQEYDYTPKPMVHIPPITKHEFKKRHEGCGQHRFHLRCNKQCPCARAKAKAHNRDIIELLPKKNSQLDMNADERIYFWGLYARQEISFFRVLVYNAICISPCIWFFFMWLFPWGHSGDQQNASVPLMTMLSFLSIFWTTFIASLWQKIDGDSA